MGFTFTMVMTFLTTTAMWLIAKAIPQRWGKGDGTIGAPIVAGVTAGIAFFFWADVSMLLFSKG